MALQLMQRKENKKYSNRERNEEMEMKREEL